MENKLKNGFSLIIGKNANGNLLANYIKGNIPVSSEKIQEVEPSILEYFLQQQTLIEALRYEQYFVFDYLKEANQFQLVLEKEMYEGEYHELVGYQIMHCEQASMIPEVIQQMKEQLMMSESEKIKTQLSLYEPLFTKIQQGYQFSLKTNSNQEFVGVLARIEKEVYNEFRELEERDFAFIYDVKNLKKSLRGGRVFDLSYDQSNDNFQATLKEKSFYDAWHEQVNWKDAHQEVAPTAVDAIVKLNEKIGEEREKKIYVKR